MPDEDAVREAERVLQHARDEGVLVKLLGGAAVAVLAPNRPSPLKRSIWDLDLMTDRENLPSLERLLVKLGYHPDIPFNAASGRDRRRLQAHGRGHVDVFVDRFRMCHEIPLSDRLAEPGVTIPLPELLLTKLQIVELTPKDISDVHALTHECVLTAHDFARIASICAVDWGLWKTVTLSLERCSAALGRSQLEAGHRQTVDAQLAAIRSAIDETSKSRRWQIRALIGTRSRWYELPEEVE